MSLHFLLSPFSDVIFRDFTDQGRIEECFCGYIFVLNLYGWKLPREVLHCNTKMDKLNVLGVFYFGFHVLMLP